MVSTPNGLGYVPRPAGPGRCVTNSKALIERAAAMTQPIPVDFTTIRSYLADPRWHETEVWETEHDNRAIGVMLAALSKLMLPYWQARYRRDEKMEQLVERIIVWALAPSPKTQLALFDYFQSMSVEIYPDG